MRAERRLGEILKRMAQNGERASKAGDRISREARGDTTLSDLGIPRDRASRAMQLAEVPQDQFESALAEGGTPRPPNGVHKGVHRRFANLS